MKRKFKVGKWFVTLMAMVVLLAACGGGSTNSPSDTDSSNSSNTPNSTTDVNQDPYEAVIVYAVSNVPSDNDLVEAEINKIMKEKINTTVKLLPITNGPYDQQTNLMLSSNERVDLIYTKGGLYPSFVEREQIIAVDDLLEQYGQGIVDVFNEVAPNILEAAKIKGKSYGIPTIREYGSYYGVAMRKDILDKYNIDYTKINTLEDLDEVYEVVKVNEPNMTPLIKHGNTILRNFYSGYTDSLGDFHGVLPGYDNDLQVVNWFDTDEYKYLLDTVRRWYQAGYISTDVTTNKEDKYALMKADRAFSWLSLMKPGYAESASRPAGTEMVAVELMPGVGSTSTVTNIMWSIPRNSEKPERAMQVLNLMYTDPDIMNLLIWGIEGKHYVVQDNGLLNYPEGVNATNSGYVLNQGWMMGNQFLAHIFEGDPINLWDDYIEFNKSLKLSKAMGFAFDIEPVKTEKATVTNVESKYRAILENGTVDPKEYLPKFLEELERAGMNTIIEEKQRQLDEWLKTR